MSKFLAVPKISDKVPKEYRQALVALRHNVAILTGDAPESTETPIKVPGAGTSGSATPVPSGTPTRIQGLIATPRPLAIELEWSNPGTNVFLVVIYRATTNNFNVAVPIGVSRGRKFVDYLGEPGAERFYWSVGINTTAQAASPSLVAKATSQEVSDTQIGVRTIDDQLSIDDDDGTLTELFSWLANRVRTITGEADWKDDPAINLSQANEELEEAQASISQIRARIDTIPRNQAAERLYLARTFR